MKLSNCINKPDQSLKYEGVCVDNKCKLGKWIYSERAKYNIEPHYTTLKNEHAKFHKKG